MCTSELQASDRCLKRPFFNVGALCKFHVIEGQNARDQIAFFAFHFFFQWKFKRMLATNVPSMRKSTLEIKIEGSACRL